MADLFPRAARAAGYRDTGPAGPATWMLPVDNVTATGSDRDDCPFLSQPPGSNELSVSASNTTVPQATGPATVTQEATTPAAEPTGEVAAMGGDVDDVAPLGALPRARTPLPKSPVVDWEAPPVAQWGLRGLLNRLLHLSLLAGSAESAWSRDRNTVRRASWSRMQRVSVLGLEGGVGRTTLTAALTLALGEARRGEVVGIDLNADGGTLGAISEPGGLGIDGLLGNTSVDTVAAMRSFVARQPTPGDILAWTQAPTCPLTPDEINRITATVERYYTIAVRDLDASPWTSPWEHTVASSDAVLLVASPTERGARAAERARTHIARVAPDLLASCVHVGVGGIPPGPEDGPEWLVVPHDPELGRTTVHWDALHRRTRTALISVARATVLSLKEI